MRADTKTSWRRFIGTLLVLTIPTACSESDPRGPDGGDDGVTDQSW